MTLTSIITWIIVGGIAGRWDWEVDLALDDQHVRKVQVSRAIDIAVEPSDQAIGVAAQRIVTM